MQIKNRFFVFVSILVGGAFLVAGIFFFEIRTSVQLESESDSSAKNDKIYASAKQFFESTSADGTSSTSGQIHWANFDKHQDTVAISLDAVLSGDRGTLSVEEKAFVRFMSQKYFDVFRYRNGDAVNYGLYFSFEHLENYPGNSYEDAVKALDAWGPNMLVDLHGLLFPTVPISSRDMGQVVTFSQEYFLAKDLGLKYKSAKIILNSAEEEIYYGIVDGDIIVTTSKESLFKASRELFSLVP